MSDRRRLITEEDDRYMRNWIIGGAAAMLIVPPVAQAVAQQLDYRWSYGRPSTTSKSYNSRYGYRYYRDYERRQHTCEVYHAYTFGCSPKWRNYDYWYNR